MPRGGMKIVPVKPTEADNGTTSAPKSNWRRPFMSRSSGAVKVTSSTTDLTPVAEIGGSKPDGARELPTLVGSTITRANTDSIIGAGYPTSVRSLPVKPDQHYSSSLHRPSVSLSLDQGFSKDAAATSLLDNSTSIEDTPSGGSSSSIDTASILTGESASVFSSNSSIYSSGSSLYSNDDYFGGGAQDKWMPEKIAEEPETGFGAANQATLQQSQPLRPTPVRRGPPVDAAAKERSVLAKKAALFKNSKLSPSLPSFITTLQRWALITRAAQASVDCYDHCSATRRGSYTPADTNKDIKAMIVDDQLIDDSRLIVVAIRGTKVQSMSDWSVNRDSKAVEPIGFLDDEKNACHVGFMQVARAMVDHIAEQLKQLPPSSERPILLFTGHSAGGAVAALLYSHMLSAVTVENAPSSLLLSSPTTVPPSSLTTIASQFSSINCITFGAPPISVTPLPRRELGNGVFWAFANEGDPVLRMSNPAYVKSLAKLMTTSAGAVAAPAVKVLRRSRGTAVIRKEIANDIPWDELPVWPTPAADLCNAGDVILLRDFERHHASASRVTADDLSDAIFADLMQHTSELYVRRVNQVALAAMMGRA